MAAADSKGAGPPAGAPPLLVRQTSVELACSLYGEKAKDIIVSVEQQEKDATSAKGKGLPALQNCIFVGHNNTDLDSVGSAIGAAELFGGVALRASHINSETKFALQAWGLTEPALFSEAGVNAPTDGKSVDLSKRLVCLVDHNQVSQTPPGLDTKRVRAIIDHHAIQSGIVTSEQPIHVDIRPWGSTCTIITQLFIDAGRRMHQKTAGILLSGILSDTLNCQSPTTTEHDQFMVSVLSRWADVKDINGLAQRLFKAKSRELLTMGPHAVMRGDLKRFDINSAKGKYLIAFGVVETVDLPTLLTMRDGLLEEIKALKKEMADGEQEKAKKDSAYKPCTPLVLLALVDINAIHGTLLCGTTHEQSLGERVYGGSMNATSRLLDLGKRVSRKKDFLPPVQKCLENGWEVPALAASEHKELADGFGEVVLSCTDHGCILKRKPLKWRTVVRGVMALAAMGGGSVATGAERVRRLSGQMADGPTPTAALGHAFSAQDHDQHNHPNHSHAGHAHAHLSQAAAAAVAAGSHSHGHAHGGGGLMAAAVAAAAASKAGMADH